MKGFKYLLLLSFLSIGTSAYSQVPEDYGYSKIKNAPDRIFDLFIDKKGFIWMGHDFGITRFDGTSFISYHNNRQKSLGIDNILEDNKGRIWCRNFNGQVFYIENEKMNLLETKDSTLSLSLFKIVNDELIAKCNKGIFVYNINKDSRRVISNIGSYSLDKIQETIFRYGQKVFFLLPENNKTILLEYNNGRIPAFRSELEGNYSNILNITDHQLLLKSYVKNENNDRYTLFSINDKQISKKKSFRIKGGEIFSISSKNKNEIWVHTSKKSILLNDSIEINNLSLTDYLEDREGNIWASSLIYGLLLKKRKPDWELFPSKQSTSRITSLTFLNNKIIIETTNNQTLIADTSNFLNLENNKIIRFSHRALGAIAVDSFYYIYGHGLMKLNKSFKLKNSYATYLTDASIIDNDILVFASPSGMVALPTNKKSFAKLENKKPNIINTHFSYDKDKRLFYSKLEKNKKRVRGVHYSPYTKTLYAGYSHGLFEYTKNFSKEIKLNGIPIYVYDMKSYDSNIYAATLNNGIIILNKGKIINQLNQSNGLSSNSILKLKLFGTHLWILGLDGMQLYDIAEKKFINSVVFPPVKSTQVLDLLELNDNVYFATIEGVYKTPISKNKKVVLPLNYLLSVVANSTDTFQNGAKLDYKNNSLQFNLVGLYYFNSSGIQFAYRLLGSGLDTNWQYTASLQNQILFPNVAPGTYTLEAFAKTEDGLAAENKILFSFTILKPWWQQLWFILGITIIISIFSYILITMRIESRKKANKLIIDKLKYESAANDSELKALKSQMNPHFIFNSLNTIQEMFMWGDKNAANEQLSNFAMLIRLILSVSGKKSISLSTEVDILDRYLELEKMRFQGSFSYEIIIDENIDEDYIKIPPMILQPFVENSIKHGLLHKEGEKKLTITFNSNAEGNYIECTIIDNGIGREKASEIKKTSNYTHNNFAIDAIRKQLNIMRKDANFNTQLSITYLDLKDEIGKVEGTLVKITIPTFYL